MAKFEGRLTTVRNVLPRGEGMGRKTFEYWRLGRFECVLIRCHAFDNVVLDGSDCRAPIPVEDRLWKFANWVRRS